MAVARPLPRSTPYMCAVVTELLDLGLGERATVQQLADWSGVNREAVRWCLNRLQDSLLADAEHDPTPRHGPDRAAVGPDRCGPAGSFRSPEPRPPSDASAREVGLMDSGRTRGTPPLTDANRDVGKALLAAGREVTVTELTERSGRSDRTVRRVLHEMQDRQWVSRRLSSGWEVWAGTALWAYTEAGRRRARCIYRNGRQSR